MAVTTKLCKMIIYIDGLLPINPWLSSNGFARPHDKLKPLYSTATVPMATKLGRMLTYLEVFLTINLYNALTARSCKVTR